MRFNCINSRDKENVIVCAPVILENEFDKNFESVIERLENHFNDVREHKEAAFKQQYVDLTNRLIDKQKDITAFTEDGNLEKAGEEIKELSAIAEKAAFVKAKLLEMDITAEDVKALRSIQPARKSVQNMLKNEVAQTPKFEKLLNEEMGAKSAFEMRNSNNEWRNDESKTAVVVNVQKRERPEKLPEIRKRNDVPRGIFTNRDTGIDIQLSKRSIEEVITNAIYDDKRGVPVEARMEALYQMQDLIENAVCFDSQISEPSLEKKSINTLFIHRMYGVFNYENELYLFNVAIEETYATDREEHFRNTTNRLYNFDDIKITPVKLQGGQALAIPQNASTDTSQSVTVISIPQLYDLVKTYDEYFFENPKYQLISLLRSVLPVWVSFRLYFPTILRD